MNFNYKKYSELNDNFVMTYAGFSSHLMIDIMTGHSRFDPMPPSALLEQFYNGKFTRGAKPPSPETEFREEIVGIMGEVIEYLHGLGAIKEKTGFTFHDIGCGYGAGVWAMQKLGAKATGNEMNRDWVEQANQVLHGSISARPLDEVLDNLGYTVDVFLCTHVLEHLADPLWHLKQISKNMSDSGVAYICVPNSHNLLTLIGGRRNDKLFQFPMHLQYFTPKSLAAMLRESGLEPVQGNTRTLEETDSYGRWPIEALFGLEPNMAVDQAAWNHAQCQNFLGGEIFMLATKHVHPTARRNPNLDSEIERAFKFFNAAREGIQAYKMNSTKEHAFTKVFRFFRKLRKLVSA